MVHVFSFGAAGSHISSLVSYSPSCLPINTPYYSPVETHYTIGRPVLVVFLQFSLFLSLSPFLLFLKVREVTVKRPLYSYFDIAKTLLFLWIFPSSSEDFSRKFSVHFHYYCWKLTKNHTPIML